MFGALAAYGLAAYAYDVVWRPSVVAAAARAYADSVGKPLLNVGAGTPGSSARVAILGPTQWGDVNCDLNGDGSGGVCKCDAHALAYPDSHFGAAIASHVVEHVDDPEVVINELCRVADAVYIITPLWWAPHTWLHPGHQWYRRDNGEFVRLYSGGAGEPAFRGYLDMVGAK